MVSAPKARALQRCVCLSALALACAVAWAVSRAAFAVGTLPAPRTVQPPASGHPGVSTFASGAGLDYGALALGCTLSSGVVASALLTSKRTQPKIVARVSGGSPSLIQVLEQKKLLSLASNLKLLSKAEAAGISIDTVEKLGLLKLADDQKLLTLAESTLTDGSTPVKLLGLGLLLGGAAYADATAADFGFLQWVIAGALGAPALVLVGAAFVIFGLTSGTRRTKSLDRVDKVTKYDPNGDFSTTPLTSSVTLVEAVQEKKVLSFLEANGLLSLAAGFVNKPLTLTEALLPDVEASGLLSTVESTAAETYGAAKIASVGLIFLVVSLICFFLVPAVGGLLGVLALLAGLAVIVAGVVVGTLQVPPRFVR